MTDPNDYTSTPKLGLPLSEAEETTTLPAYEVPPQAPPPANPDPEEAEQPSRRGLIITGYVVLIVLVLALVAVVWALISGGFGGTSETPSSEDVTQPSITMTPDQPSQIPPTSSPNKTTSSPQPEPEKPQPAPAAPPAPAPAPAETKPAQPPAPPSPPQPPAPPAPGENSTE